MPTLTPEALDLLNVEQLRKLAAQDDIELADDAKKADIIAALSTPDVAGPVADIAEPDASNETKEELPDGRLAAHRPVTFVNEHGDWRDPHSGLLVFHGQSVNPTNTAKVDLPADRRRKKDDNGQVYVPVATGDDVIVVYEVL